MEVEAELQYRTVGQADAKAVFDFLQPFMQQGFLLDRTLDEVNKLSELGYAAFDGARIVGFAAVEVYSKKLAELQCLAVDSDYRRRGIGRSLVHWCCETAKKQGVHELLAISSSDEMFVACGFGYSLPNQKRALFFRAGGDNDGCQ